MSKETLYAIMQSVLEENGGPMHPSDLAEETRSKGLYTQRDGTPLKDVQIHARVSNRPDLFVRVDGMISINKSIEDCVKKEKFQLRACLNFPV